MGHCTWAGMNEANQSYHDKEWGIPVRYAAWMWPTTQGGKPVLDEEFTYTKLRFNCGFTDWDFNEKNKEYKF